jgi:hypothetical protein
MVRAVLLALLLTLLHKLVSLSPLSMIPASDFSYMKLTSLNKLPIHSLLRDFIINVCWNFPDDFSASTETIFENLSVWWTALIDFQVLNHPCIPKKKTLLGYTVLSLLYISVFHGLIFKAAMLTSIPPTAPSTDYNFVRVFLYICSLEILNFIFFL